MNDKMDYLRPTLFLVYIAVLMVTLVMDYPSLAIFVFLDRVVYAVLVSMLIHRWGESARLLVESEKNAWIAYVHGMPVRQSTHSLKNLHFPSVESMRRGYTTLLLPRLMIALAMLGVTLLQVYQHYQASGGLKLDMLGCAIAAFLLFKFSSMARALNCVQVKRWTVNRYTLGEQAYFSAFRQHRKDAYTPFLYELFR